PAERGPGRRRRRRPAPTRSGFCRRSRRTARPPPVAAFPGSRQATDRAAPLPFSLLLPRLAPAPPPAPARTGRGRCPQRHCPPRGLLQPGPRSPP
ncbi:unnamed protein product, partial [Bubo scandiacus]